MDIPVREFLFGSIFLLSNKLQVLGDGYLGEITLKQWLLLISLKTMGREEPSVSDTADFMGCSRQNVRKMIEVLEKKGYVSLCRSKRDRRNLSVALTPQAYCFFERFQEKGDIFLDLLFGNIEPGLLQSSRQVFEKLFENIERMEQEYV